MTSQEFAPLAWVYAADRQLWIPWLVGALLGTAILVVLTLGRHLILRRLAPRAARSRHIWDDMVVDVAQRMRQIFIWTLGLAAAVAIWPLSPRIGLVMHRLLVLVSSVQIGLWGAGLVEYLVVGAVLYTGHSSDPEYKTARNMVRTLGLTLVWAAVLLVCLDNLGVEVNTLIAGLGVSSVAVALATQNIVRDMFSSLSIVIDQPFLVGDTIAVGDQAGVVERIGLKTTRLRSVNGEELVYANSDLISSRIQNFRTLQQRRMVFTLDIRADISPEQMDQVVPLIKAAIVEAGDTRLDRANLASMAHGILHYDAVYYVTSNDYAVYVARHEKVLTLLWRSLRRAQIALALPAQTMHHEWTSDLRAKLEGGA